MGIKVRYIKGKGLVQTETSSGGSTVDLDAAAVVAGVSPGKRTAAADTASATLTGDDAGMHTLSGSGTGDQANDLVITLPDPASVPLAIYGFRMTDARSHVLTSSAPGAVLAFVPPSGSFGVAGVGINMQSSHMSMSAIVGSSVMLQSDGLHYLAYAASGSHTFETT